MKHSTKIIAATVLLSVALLTNSYAQEATTIAMVQPSYTNNTFNVEDNKSIKTDFAANPVITAKFSTLFPTATSQKWTSGADNVWVSFLHDGQKASASFTPKGKLNYIITNCAMENLPAAFSKTITNQYAAYHLFNAIKIAAHGNVAYQAILEDSYGYITLKYTSEGIEEIQQVKKK